MMEMLIECLLECDHQLPNDYAEKRDGFLETRSEIMDPNNVFTKVRKMQNDFRN